MSDFLVISCSLNPESKSRKLAAAALEGLKSAGASAQWIDLRDLNLPLCELPAGK